MFRSSKAPVWLLNASGWAAHMSNAHRNTLSTTGWYVINFLACVCVRLPGDRERGPHSRFVEIVGWRSSKRCQRDRPLLWYKHELFFIDLCFIVWYFIKLYSVYLQVKRAIWPSRGWTSFTLRCRRRLIRTKRPRSPFYRRTSLDLKQAECLC